MTKKCYNSHNIVLNPSVKKDLKIPKE